MKTAHIMVLASALLILGIALFTHGNHEGTTSMGVSERAREPAKPELKGKTVLDSTGNMGWHLKNQTCPGTNRKAELTQTSDPRIFGPIIWPGLHIMAENYPEKADKDHKKACVNFLRGLPWMLPCGDCGSHLLKRESGQGDVPIDQLIDSLKDDDKRKQRNKNIRKACSDRKALRSYLVEAHNNVNKNNRKPEWTAADAQNKYCQIPACLEPCETYGENKCKSIPGCVWNTDQMACQGGWFEDGIPYPTSTPCTDEK